MPPSSSHRPSAEVIQSIDTIITDPYGHYTNDNNNADGTETTNLNKSADDTASLQQTPTRSNVNHHMKNINTMYKYVLPMIWWKPIITSIHIHNGHVWMTIIQRIRMNLTRMTIISLMTLTPNTPPMPPSPSPRPTPEMIDIIIYIKFTTRIHMYYIHDSNCYLYQKKQIIMFMDTALCPISSAPQ